MRSYKLGISTIFHPSTHNKGAYFGKQPYKATSSWLRILDIWRWTNLFVSMCCAHNSIERTGLTTLCWKNSCEAVLSIPWWPLLVDTFQYAGGRTNKDGWGRASLQVWHKSVRPMNRVHSTWHSQDLFWKLIPPKCWSIPKSKVGFWYGMHVWDVAFHACTHTYSMTHRSYSGCWYDVLPLLRDTDT